MKLIALCGAPKAGKSEVQSYLQWAHGFTAIDDGAPLRQIACEVLGLRWEDVTTQTGKQRAVSIPGGTSMIVRKVLGNLGNSLEAVFGQDILMHIALENVGPLRPRDKFCFGSVRRSQGAVIKKHGGVVIEIKRDGCEIENEFDRYDESLVDFTVNNNSTVRELHDAIDRLVPDILRPS